MNQQSMSPPHGPMGLIEVPFYRYWGETAYLVGGLLLLTLVLLAVFLHREKKKLRPRLEDPRVERWRQIRSELEALTLSPMPSSEQVAEFSLRLSALLRRALEHQLGGAATRQTLRELEQSLRQERRISPEAKEQLLQFLSWAEAQKFAAPQLQETQDCKAWLAKVQLWIQALQEGTL